MSLPYVPLLSIADAILPRIPTDDSQTVHFTQNLSLGLPPIHTPPNARSSKAAKILHGRMCVCVCISGYSAKYGGPHCTLK
jgi:hypothetical protein